MLEVHPINSGYDRRNDQHGGPSRDLLDLIVLGYARLREAIDLFGLLDVHLRKLGDLLTLGEVHQGKVDAEDVLQQLTQRYHLVGKPQGVVPNVAEVTSHLRIDLVSVVLDQVRQDLHQWRGGPSALDRFARKFVDAPRDGHVPAEYLGLYLV